MRIIAGEWRGLVLAGPPGQATRPTADRLRQAVFDMLLHATWGGREIIAETHVLDAFAGTGALGLEALSRGAAHATFVERDKAALGALRANVARCRAEERATILPRDVFSIGSAARPVDLIFLDPPYGAGLIPRALAALRAAGWLAPSALIVAETTRSEAAPTPIPPLAERTYGAARVTVWREGAEAG